MNNSTDFIIEEGIFKKYKGNKENVVIPEGITDIQEAAFIDCANLKSVVFPKSLKRIESMAFLSENPLSIFIPAGVQEIGVNAFFGAGVSDIEVDSENAIYHSSDGCLIETKSKTLMICCDYNKIPTDGTVEIIGSCAFGKILELPDASASSLVIPNGIKVIQDSAFWFANIKKVVLPDTLSIIGANAFMDCHELESITIPAGVKKIGDSAFDDDWKLRSVKVLSIDVEFGDNVFADCDDLVISASTGSNAEKYAEKYGIQFEVCDLPN